MNIKKIKEVVDEVSKALENGNYEDARDLIENLRAMLKSTTESKGWQKNKDEYFAYLKTTREIKTVKDHRIKLEKAEEFLKEKYGYLPNPASITEKDAREYLYWLKLKGYDRNYYRRVFQVFIQFLAFSMNPRAFKMRFLVPREDKKPILYMAMEDVKKALEMFGEQNFEELKHRTMIWIYAWTGIRYSEVIVLKKDDIDLKNNLIIVRKGKGGHERVVYIPPVLKGLLEKYIERWEKYMKLREEMGMRTSEYLFFWIKRNGEIMDPYWGFRGYFKHFADRAKEVGIEKFNIKKFRATIAKLLREIGGVDLSTVSAQLGHSRTSTTEEFYHRMGPVGLEKPYEKVEKLLLGDKKDD